MSKIKRHEAEQQVRDEHWQCKTCAAPALEDEPYCLSCKMYWEDVDSGAFDYWEE